MPMYLFKTKVIRYSYRDEEEGGRLEERLQLQHLEEMRLLFSLHEPPVLTATPSLVQHPDLPPPRLKNQRMPGLLTREEFKDVVVKVLGTHAYDDQLDNLFMKLDVSCDGYVDWTEFCNYMLRQFRENDYMSAKKPLPFHSEPKIRHIVHNRQETTTKVMAIDNPLKYVTVSKEGALSVFDSQLHFEKYFLIAEGDEAGGNTRGARRIRYWVTDAVYMPNSRKIAVATTGRDIRFVDVTSSTFVEDFHLFSLPNVPTCLEYVYNKESPSDEALLIFGDESGNINLLYFSKPMQQLFETPFKKDDGVLKIYYPELKQHVKFVRYVQLADIHPAQVRRVVYQRDNECILSCSASPSHSVVIIDIDRKKKTYVWKISKGVECFDYKKALNVMVTGSADHLVRVWNPYVTSKPVAILSGHHMSIVDVKLHEALSQIFSFSRDAMLKIWDIKDQVCLQSITVKFPCSMLGRLPEYGPFTMHLQLTPGRCLMISANDYIAQLKLGTVGPPRSTRPTSHATQLCCALYNPLFKTVVTGADDSSVGVWDMETGAKSMLFTHAHGNDEITCMTFDNGLRRLFTGARNGSIKVWNIQNGHNLCELAAVDEAEITGILPLHDKKKILAVGWSRMISVYDDSDSDNQHVKADTSWQGVHMHKEDILCIAHLPPYLIATCSFDGEISVWNIETRNLYVKLRKGQQLKMSKELYAVILGQYLRPLTPAPRSTPHPRSTPPQHASHPRHNDSANSHDSLLDTQHRMSAGSRRAGSSRPNSRHRKSHKPPHGQPAPVDKILFLKARAAHRKRNEAAILISSEAGTLIFWSIHGAFHNQGSFYACEVQDESVLGLDTNADDSMLVSGDTTGRVTVWDIASYCSVYREQERCTARPERLFSWHAHDTAIVSVQHVQHDCGQFVLTASTDHTAKLFTLHGFAVGVFGQKALWNIRLKKTWEECPPDYDEDQEEVTSQHSAEHSDADSADEQLDLDANIHTETKIPSKLIRESTGLSIPTIERGETLSDFKENGETTTREESHEAMTNEGHDKEESGSEESALTDTDFPYPTKTTKAMTAQPARAPKDVNGETTLKSRSVTFHYGAKQPLPLPHKSLLGSTVDKRLSKMTQDRQDRRMFVEREVSSKPTNRLGKICCPYQAINIPEIADIAIPRDLPLSPRMINRGFTSENLKLEDILRSMDSTLGETETTQTNDTANNSTNRFISHSTTSFESTSGRLVTATGSRCGRNTAGLKLPSLGQSGGGKNKRRNSATSSAGGLSARRGSSVANGPRRLSPIQS